MYVLPVSQPRHVDILHLGLSCNTGEDGRGLGLQQYRAKGLIDGSRIEGCVTCSGIRCRLLLVSGDVSVCPSLAVPRCLICVSCTSHLSIEGFRAQLLRAQLLLGETEGERKIEREGEREGECVRESCIRNCEQLHLGTRTLREDSPEGATELLK